MITQLKKWCIYVKNKINLLRNKSLSVYDNDDWRYVYGVRSYDVSGTVMLTNTYYNSDIVFVGDGILNIDTNILVNNFRATVFNKGNDSVEISIVGGKNIYAPYGLKIKKDGYVLMYMSQNGFLIIIGDLSQ